LSAQPAGEIQHRWGSSWSAAGQSARRGERDPTRRMSTAKRRAEDGRGPRRDAARGDGGRHDEASGRSCRGHGSGRLWFRRRDDGLVPGGLPAISRWTGGEFETAYPLRACTFGPVEPAFSAGDVPIVQTLARPFAEGRLCFEGSPRATFFVFAGLRGLARRFAGPRLPRSPRRGPDTEHRHHHSNWPHPCFIVPNSWVGSGDGIRRPSSASFQTRQRSKRSFGPLPVRSPTTGGSWPELAGRARLGRMSRMGGDQR